MEPFDKVMRNSIYPSGTIFMLPLQINSQLRIAIVNTIKKLSILP